MSSTWWDTNPRDWIAKAHKIRDTLYPAPSVTGKGTTANDGSPSVPDLSYCLCLQVHAADGAAAEPGGSSSCGISQRHFRRTARSHRQVPPPMIRHIITAFAALGLAACTAHVAPPQPIAVAAPERRSRCRSSPSTISTATSKRRRRSKSTDPNGQQEKIVTGGASHLAAALAGLRAGHSNTITVSAGDTIGASPLISANYLDEPTIDAMNLLHLEIDSVGNHEFDRGADELKRMQSGAAPNTRSERPCAVEPFGGAQVSLPCRKCRAGDGTTIFPATAIKRFPTPAGTITIGFIGETLKGTANLVTPSGVRGPDVQGRGGDGERAGPRAQGAGRGRDRPAHPSGRQDATIHASAMAATVSRAKSCQSCSGSIPRSPP